MVNTKILVKAPILCFQFLEINCTEIMKLLIYYDLISDKQTKNLKVQRDVCDTNHLLYCIMTTLCMKWLHY